MAYALVTPARNEEAFIGQTLAAVVSQSAKPLRWVIVSDGSTDRTEAIVGAVDRIYRACQLRLKLSYQVDNSRQTGNWSTSSQWSSLASSGQGSRWGRASLGRGCGQGSAGVLVGEFWQRPAAWNRSMIGWDARLTGRRECPQPAKIRGSGTGALSR